MIPRLYNRLRQNDVVIAVIAALGLYVLWLLWPVVVIVFIALVLTVALLPLVNYLDRFRWIPRALAVLIVYLGLAGLLALIGYFVFPPLINQLQNLLRRLPEIISQLPFVLDVQINQGLLSFLQERLESLRQIAITVSTTALVILLAIISIIVISIYWLVDYENIKQFILKGFRGRQQQAAQAFTNVERRLGGWVRGQIILSTTVAILYLIAYLLIGLPAAVPLAVLAGVLEIIPILGPTLAAIPALLIALTISPFTLLITLVAYLVIQQIEGNYLAPKIMSRSAHLHPLAVIIIFLVASELGGIIGVLIAIPGAVFVLALWHRRRSEAGQPNSTAKTNR